MILAFSGAPLLARPLVLLYIRPNALDKLRSLQSMVPSRFWHSRAAFAALALLGLAALPQTAAAQTVVYDGLNTGTVATFTGSTPRTFMGQAFQVANPGGPVSISSIRVVLVVGGAHRP
jgi:hypothetical protein